MAGTGGNSRRKVKMSSSSSDKKPPLRRSEVIARLLETRRKAKEARGVKDRKEDLSRPWEPPSVLVDSSTTPARTYHRGGTLGKGTFARVFGVTDQQTEQKYAVKVFDKMHFSLKKGKKEQVEKEIEMHRKLSHVNVIDFFGCFEDRYHVYLVLELAPNKTLLDVSRARGALSEPEVRYFFSQMAAGVRYIHEKRILHRDLKPGNILVNNDCTIQICDFGLARSMEGIYR